MVQQADKVKIYTEQLQLQKLTLDDMGCMINHSGQGALHSRNQEDTLGSRLHGDWSTYLYNLINRLFFLCIISICALSIKKC